MSYSKSNVSKRDIPKVTCDTSGFEPANSCLTPIILKNNRNTSAKHANPCKISTPTEALHF